MDANELKQKQDAIDEKIKKVWQHAAGLDGIVDIDEYSKRKIKVLWVLKETRDDPKRDGGSFDYRKWVEFSGEYSQWKATWGNIADVSLGIRLYADKSLSAHNFVAESLTPLKVNYGEIYTTFEDENDWIYPMRDIAIINIKKEPKKATENADSNQSLINAEYEKPEVKKLLLEQVEAINPDVIIIGCQVPHFAEDVSKAKLDEFKYSDESKITRCHFDGKKLFIYTHHPNLRGIKREDYLNSIFAAVKQYFNND